MLSFAKMNGIQVHWWHSRFELNCNLNLNFSPKLKLNFNLNLNVILILGFKIYSIGAE